jgi:hypothetical protein
MSTSTTYRQSSYDPQTKMPEITISWTRSENGQSKSDEELSVSVLRDWKKRIEETMTYDDVVNCLAGWSNHSLSKFGAGSSAIIQSALAQFVSDVDTLYAEGS